MLTSIVYTGARLIGSRNEVIKIIADWIFIARTKGLTDFFKGFWLLHDYAKGDVFSPKFYKRHEAEVISFLNKLDWSKPDVKKVIDYFKPPEKEELF